MQKFLLRGFLAIALLLALVIGLIQIPAVQNYLIDKLTTYLSKELNTTVSLERISIDFFDELVLEDFLVARSGSGYLALCAFPKGRHPNLCPI